MNSQTLLFRFKKIPIYLDTTFILFMGIFVIFGLREGLQGFFREIYIVLALTLNILWHEWGHAWAGLRWGLRPKSIVLWGLGGVTHFHPSYRPPTALQSIGISLAGPGFGFILGTLFWVSSHVFFLGQWAPLWLLDFWDWMILMAWVLNLANLLPVQPLDGGQALKVFLGMKGSAYWAQRWSALIALGTLTGVSLLFLILGISDLFLWFLILMGFFINAKALNPLL